MNLILDIESFLNSLPENKKAIDISHRNLKSLVSISRFINLKRLSCCGNQFLSLPILPPNLQDLWCSGNQLVSLPILPPSLKTLECNNNRIVSLPNLPRKLIYLNCSGNQLSTLPTLSPNSLLQYSDCSKNPIGIDNLKEYKIYNQFKFHYYSCKFGPRFKKFFAIKRNCKFKNEFLTIIYSPDYNFYKQFLDPSTKLWIENSKQKV